MKLKNNYTPTQMINFFSIATFLIVLVLFLGFSIWNSIQYTKQEKSRISNYERQLKGAFELDLQRTASEAYYDNFEAITLRVKNIAEKIGDGKFNLTLFKGASNKCVLQATDKGITDCKVAKLLSLKKAKDKTQFFYHTERESYVYQAALTSAGVQVGIIEIMIRDPYQFYRGHPLFLTIQTFLFFTFIAFSVLLFWYLFANRKYLQPALNKIVEMETKEATARVLYEQARKLIHDLKPLAHNLEVQLTTHKYIPQALRKSLRNIQSAILNMASDLSEHKNPIGPSEVEYSLISKSVAIATREALSFIDSNKNISIEHHVDDRLNLTWVKLTNFDLEKRVLSNLIRNSIEALHEREKGLITINASLEEDQVHIKVTDDGPGMSTELIFKATTIGLSTKLNGSGLGLKIIQDIVSKAGGKFMVESELDQGTIAHIWLPITKKPSWLTHHLRLDLTKKIVILEDHPEAIITLKSRLKDFKLIILSNIEDFTTKLYPPDKFQYLFDYDIKGSILNGLDVISRNDIASSSTLITTYYNEPFVQKRAAKIGVKILPKFLVETARVIDINELKYPLSKTPDVVLIDDCEIKHNTFTNFYANKGKNCLCVFSEKEFDGLSVDVNTPILVDYEFGKSKSLLKRKHQEGFKKLYVATSHLNAKQELIDYPFLKGIIDEPTMNIFS